MQPAYRTINGSPPAKKPCSHIGLRGTADEQSAATEINSPAGRTPISAGPVPLYLIPQTISTEIHAHGGGDISEITVRRARHHFYAISLTKTAPGGRRPVVQMQTEPGTLARGRGRTLSVTIAEESYHLGRNDINTLLNYGQSVPLSRIENGTIRPPDKAIFVTTVIDGHITVHTSGRVVLVVTRTNLFSVPPWQVSGRWPVVRPYPPPRSSR